MVFAVVKNDGAGKRRPKQSGAKTLGRKKRRKNSKYAAERRITGRFAKWFSGERPVSLGFELSFYPSLSELVWRVLDREASRLYKSSTRQRAIWFFSLKIKVKTICLFVQKKQYTK